MPHTWKHALDEYQNLWWDPRDPEVQMLWTSSIELNHRLFREIVEQAVPLDMRILRAIRRSPLGIDLYMLITNEQVGSEPNRRGTKDVSRFRANAIRELKKLKNVWPELRYRIRPGTFEKDGYLVLPPNQAQDPATDDRDPQRRLIE